MELIKNLFALSNEIRKLLAAGQAEATMGGLNSAKEIHFALAALELIKSNATLPTAQGLMPFIDAHPEVKKLCDDYSVFWYLSLLSKARGQGTVVYNLEFQVPMEERIQHPERHHTLSEAERAAYAAEFLKPIDDRQAHIARFLYTYLSQTQRLLQAIQQKNLPAAGFLKGINEVICRAYQENLSTRAAQLERASDEAVRKRSQIQATNLLGLASTVDADGIVLAQMGAGHVGDELELLKNDYSILVIE